jgi:ABC-2 type transport system permease protein
MTPTDANRVRAVVLKELREYRRRRSIIATMAILPIFILVADAVAVFVVPQSTVVLDARTYVVSPILYLLLIPVVMPSTLAGYAVAGEREQGTLEPLLTTPVQRKEFILGKAVAVALPTMILSYGGFVLFLGAVALFAKPAISSATFGQGALVLALFLLAPLLAGWAIAVGMIASVKATDVRVAQQLGTLVSLPPVLFILMLATGVIHLNYVITVIVSMALLLIDYGAFRIVARMMIPERLVVVSRDAKAR